MEVATGASDFDATFGGRIVRSADTDYDELRKVFNGMIDRRPGLIACCDSTADVVAAVDHARESGLPVAVYGGGHGVTGHAVCDDGVCIDLRPMNSVEVDAEAKTARVGGGANWGVVDAATQEHGLAVTGGRVPSTGVAGLALGSGSGWIERKYGLTCDSLLSCEVVTADGSVLTASEDENADLFWGLRGGGGNFGVVTSFEFALHPVGPLLYAGMLMHPAERGAELLRFFRDFMADAPDEIGGAVAFISAPPEDFVPEPVRGQPVVGVIVCYVGDPADGEEALRPLVEFGPPAMNMVQPMPYTAVQRLIEPGNPHGLQNYWKADFCELPDEATEIFAQHGNGRPSPFSQAIAIPGGGAVSRVPNDAMAFGQRDASFNVHFLSLWPDPADTAANIAWSREFSSAMKPFAHGGVYLNFIGDEGIDRVREAFGDKFPRLQELKDRYDPANLFRLNQNIPPTSP
jgi:FAD/FMN-containing dehydrogenase